MTRAGAFLFAAALFAAAFSLAFAPGGGAIPSAQAQDNPGVAPAGPGGLPPPSMLAGEGPANRYGLGENAGIAGAGAAFSSPTASASASGMPQSSSTASGPAAAPAQGLQAEGDEAASQPPVVADEGMETENTDMARKITEHVAYVQPPVSPASIASLFFTPPERDLVLSARLGLNVRPPGMGTGVEDDSSVVVIGPRELALGGIVYASPKDWTIWLNTMRISPGRLPSEVMNLKVFKSYIELEWYDAATNQIFPVRLRSHQRFNLDSRIFLPGS
ncbi:MAG: hypothetical protein WC989_03485 [Micavibrio sp.]